MKTPFLAAAIVAGFVGTAQAGPVSQFDHLNGVSDALSQVEKTQYVFAGHRYCFYLDGWRGPGFYWCGYRWRTGLGWGGPSGWRGWNSPSARIYVAPRGPGYGRDMGRSEQPTFRGDREQRFGAGAPGPNRRGDGGFGAPSGGRPGPADGGRGGHGGGEDRGKGGGDHERGGGKK